MCSFSPGAWSPIHPRSRGVRKSAEDQLTSHSAAVQPLFGQLANIFGRRYITLAIVILFTLGSGIAGGASNGATLIAGRAVQGMGSGGINMIVDVIISDLIPLRQRGTYMAYILSVYFIGTAIGPYVGGAIVETTTWRWVFYINLPVSLSPRISNSFITDESRSGVSA